MAAPIDKKDLSYVYGSSCSNEKVKMKKNWEKKEKKLVVAYIWSGGCGTLMLSLQLASTYVLQLICVIFCTCG